MTYNGQIYQHRLGWGANICVGLITIILAWSAAYVALSCFLCR